MANPSIFEIIVGKLYYKKKLCPIILFKINQNSKINFYYANLSYNLAV